MANWTNLQRSYFEQNLSLVDTIAQRVETCGLANDLEELYLEHMNVDETQTTQASVRALNNPIKSGRLLKKSDDYWKPRYCVLMGDRTDPGDPSYQAGSGKLYVFESEDSLKPKNIVEVLSSVIHCVDDSLYPEKKFMFQLDTTIAQTGHTSLVVSSKNYVFCADSPEERQSWIDSLKRYSLCCLDCVCKCLSLPVSLKLDIGEPFCSLTPSSNKELNFRHIKSLKLSVIEGRDLGQIIPIELSSEQETAFYNQLRQVKNFSSYCVVEINNFELARTTVKSGYSPFWAEEFTFDDLNMCDSKVVIAIRTKSLKKNAGLGIVELEFSQIAEQMDLNQKYQAWVPISASAQNTSSTNSVALRLCASLKEEKVLPLHEYNSFIKALFENDFKVLRLLSSIGEKTVDFSKDEFAKYLCNVLTSTGLDTKAFAAIFSTEVASIHDPNIVFRGNSLASKVIDQYMKLIGQEYLKDTLSGPIKHVHDKFTKAESTEVDPLRLDSNVPYSEETLKKNQKRLLGVVQLFWDAIRNSVEKCPKQIKEAFANIKFMVLENFSRKSIPAPGIQYTSISAFIFLRFFCPAILTPKLFDLWTDISENAVATRTLTLIAKIIQNLANLSEFKKEPHMDFCNTWISSNMDSMRLCLTQFSLPPKTPKCKLNMNIDLSRNLNSLYLHLKKSLPSIKYSADDTIGVEFQDESFKPLYDILSKQIEYLENLYTKYDQEWNTNKLKISKLSHISKEFVLVNFLANSKHDKKVTKTSYISPSLRKSFDTPPIKIEDIERQFYNQNISTSTDLLSDSEDANYRKKAKKRIASIMVPESEQKPNYNYFTIGRLVDKSKPSSPELTAGLNFTLPNLLEDAVKKKRASLHRTEYQRPELPNITASDNSSSLGKFMEDTILSKFSDNEASADMTSQEDDEKSKSRKGNRLFSFFSSNGSNVKVENASK